MNLIALQSDGKEIELYCSLTGVWQYRNLTASSLTVVTSAWCAHPCSSLMKVRDTARYGP
jgi:hypothetical protein